MSDLKVRPLDAGTWPHFAALVEANGGVWGGCWCMGFHPEGLSRTSAEANRDAKLARVLEGGAHAALVYDGDPTAGVCVGWCQYGPTAELPRIKRQKAYAAGLDQLPAWRITCFYVDRRNRRRGVSAAALAGAVELIALAGGGRVESYPEDTTGRTVSSSFLHNGTTALFEAHGFQRSRPVGKRHWVVTRTVDPLTATPA